jgi:hypothetical protein
MAIDDAVGLALVEVISNEQQATAIRLIGSEDQELCEKEEKGKGVKIGKKGTKP